MKFVTTVFLISILLHSQSVLASAKEDPSRVNATLDPKEIFTYIKSDRKFLRGKHKVNIIGEFKKKSNALGKRYGNSKRVLNLRGMSLSGADLRGTTLTMADMSKTSLGKAQLQNSSLVHVDFEGADLSEADLSNADLSNAQFINTNLSGTIFKGANLFKAKFEKVSGLSGAEIKALIKMTNSYINLDKEPLPDYYAIQLDEEKKHH